MEIAQTVRQFVSETEYAVVFNSNPINLGFDRNFGRLIDLSHGEYLLFVTDDDALSAGNLDKLIETLRDTDCAVAFTPYIVHATGNIDRKFHKTMLLPAGMRSVTQYMYCSILLSGLIFKRERIPNYSAERFKNLIYSQAYLFASILNRYDGYYIDIPLVRYIGDGENAFGLNESSDKNPLMADRQSIYSNLEYHKGLKQIVEIFDSENGTNLMRGFSKEYSLKTYTGLHRARSVGRRELNTYWKKMKSLDIELTTIARVYYVALNLLGCNMCDIIFSVPRTVLLAVRQRQGGWT